MKTVNLHKLACELARADTKTKPGGYSESVIGAETTLKTPGQKPRSVSSVEAIAIIEAITIIQAIVGRAGK